MALGNQALISMEDAKAILKIQNDENDGILEMQIEGVSSLFNVYTDRILRDATYTNLELDGSGTRRMQLPNWPVTTLTSVYLDDELLAEGSDFELDYSTGILTLIEEGAVWTAGPKTVKISYAAGYALTAVPKDLRMAALTQAAFEYKQFVGQAWGVQSRGQGGSNTTYEEGGLLERVKAILEPYRRRGI
jgi:hypothetical protein